MCDSLTVLFHVSLKLIVDRYCVLNSIWDHIIMFSLLESCYWIARLVKLAHSQLFSLKDYIVFNILCDEASFIVKNCSCQRRFTQKPHAGKHRWTLSEALCLLCSLSDVLVGMCFKTSRLRSSFLSHSQMTCLSALWPPSSQSVSVVICQHTVQWLWKHIQT